MEHTTSVDAAGLERELVVGAADQEVEALVVVVLVGVGRAAGGAALLDVVVGGAAGRRHLGAGVAGRATLDVARLAGLESSVLDGRPSDDRGGERERNRRDQGQDGEELHGCGGDGGAGSWQGREATGSAGAKD